MDFDTFVSQPQRMQDRIAHQLQKAERLRAQCESATTIYSDIGKIQSTSINKREIWLTRYIDSKQSVASAMEEYDRVSSEVRDWLYENLSEEAASMMEYKFIDGLNYEEMSEVTHYAYQTIKAKMSRYIREAKAIYQQKGV